MEIDRYRKHVRELAAKRDGTPVYNSSLQHASVLAETMFEFGNKEVCIFSGKLNANVFGTPEVLKRAELFLADPATKVRVLVENGDSLDERDHPFVNKFARRDDVEFRALQADVANSVKFNYIVMDEDSYRFESDKDLPEAIASFGDEKGGKNLTQVFDELWNQSSKLFN
jgi:hypothetical protein